jgi:rSAM/selenodomain-associated transferase 1
MTKRALAIFAKHPAAAPVKTRLVPPLTIVETAQLAAAFLDDSIALAADAAKCADAVPCVFCDPYSALADMRLMLPTAFRAYGQSGGDLSERLKAAYGALAADGFSIVCFIGSDTPTLPRAFIERAFASLDRGCDVVLGPAEDGGYYLIGLKGPHLGVFEGITWSTNRVFEQTQTRAHDLGLSVEILQPWYDIDDANGLARLRNELCGTSAARALAPKTAAVLTDLIASDRTHRITFT